MGGDSEFGFSKPELKANHSNNSERKKGKQTHLDMIQVTIRVIESPCDRVEAGSDEENGCLLKRRQTMGS